MCWLMKDGLVIGNLYGSCKDLVMHASFLKLSLRHIRNAVLDSLLLLK